jgi:hypothetical protein
MDNIQNVKRKRAIGEHEEGGTIWWLFKEL